MRRTSKRVQMKMAQRENVQRELDTTAKSALQDTRKLSGRLRESRSRTRREHVNVNVQHKTKHAHETSGSSAGSGSSMTGSMNMDHTTGKNEPSSSSNSSGTAMATSCTDQEHVDAIVDGQMIAIKHAEVLTTLPLDRVPVQVLTVVPPQKDCSRLYVVEWASLDPNAHGPSDETQNVQLIQAQAFLQKFENQQMLAKFYIENTMPDDEE